MEDLKIRLVLDGVDQVQSGATRAADGLKKFGDAGARVQTQLSGYQLTQVSAQLQDFFVQIQGGQAPLTAFLQQSSQLSAVFGGFGNAAKAVASLITPTVAAIGTLAVGVGGVALAYNQGAEEAKAYTRAITLTGNAVGVTVGQLKALAQAQGEIVGTQGDAARSLTALVGTGQVSARALDATAEATTRFVRVGGEIDDIVKKFSNLGKEPVKALVELNQAENFLTESTYRQVKALADQGRETQAAVLAQQVYAAAVTQRSQRITESLGTLESGWLGVKDAAAKAWDKMLNIGRPVTLQDQLKNVQAQMQAAQDKIASAQSGEMKSARPFLDTDRIIGAQQRLIATLNERAATIGENIRLEARAAEQEAARARGVKDVIKADEDAAKAAKGLAAERQREEAALERAVGLTGSYAQDLQQLYALRQKGRLSEEQYVAAVEKLIKTQPIVREQLEAQAQAERELTAEQDKQVARIGREIDAINGRADAQEASNAVLGKSASAAEAATLAELRRQAADLDATSKVNPAYVASLNERIKAQQRLVAALDAGDVKAATEKAAATAKRELDSFLDPSRAESFGEALTRAFDGAGSSLVRMSTTLEQFGRKQAAIAAQQLNASKLTDPAARQVAQLKLAERSQQNQLSLYADMTGAAKGFFREGTAGYKALEAAETAFRVFQLASNLQQGISAATVAIANQGKGDPYTAFPRMALMAAAMAALGFVVSGAVGGGPTSGGDGAPIASGTGTVLGDAKAESESLSRSIEQLEDTSRLQLTTQSSMLQALRSIEANIGGLTGLIVQANGGDLTTGASFGVATGTSIPAVLQGLAPVQQLGIKTPIDKITNALFGAKTSITGTGLSLSPQSIGSIEAQGAALQSYIDTYSSKKFLGITYSSSAGSQYSAADAGLAQQFTKIFKGFDSALTAAAVPLGKNLDEVQKQIDGFVVNIGKIDLKDLTGKQIQEKLTAIFGATADSLASSVLPGLNEFQKVGEGYFETIVRVASGVETAQAALELLGIESVNYADLARKQGDVAAEMVRESIVAYESLDGTISSVGSLLQTLDGAAGDLVDAYQSLVDVRDMLISVGESGDSLTAAMIRGAGGLDNLQTSLGDYMENFFTADERTAAGKARLSEKFARLGLGELPTTREGFRALIESPEINASTEAGQALKAQLIGLAKAFADLVPATEQLAETADVAAQRMIEVGQRALAQLATETSTLQAQLLRAQGDAVGAAAIDRSLALARLTDGLSATDSLAVAAIYDLNQAMRDQIDATLAATRAADEAAAAETQRVNAIASERTSLEEQLLQLQGDTVAIRARELAALDPANRALLERIHMLQDAQAAEQAAAQAAADAAQRREAVASERQGLMTRIDQLMGNTAALREAELAALDPANRALLERIHMLQDAQAAEQAAAQAAADAAQRREAVASERQGLMTRIDQLMGNTAALREAELAALDPSNRALQEQIYALEEQATAAEASARAADDAARASDQLRQSWEAATKSLFDQAASIRGLITTDSPASLAFAQSKFAIATAQARAGDQVAAQQLPELARLVLELGKNQVSSQLDLDRLRAAIAASLETTGGQLSSAYGLSIPRLATGTNYVPHDMLALLHEGEAVQPRQYNPAAGGVAPGQDLLIQEVRALRAEVAALRDAASRTATASEGTRNLLNTATEGGRAMQVEDYS